MRLLSAVHPTITQKRVIAKILASPTATVAAQEISKDANLVAARNMLMKLGVIEFTTGEAKLTDKGMQIATEENIADQSGQLTSTGEQLAYTSTNGKPDDQNSQQPQQQPAAPAGLGDPMMPLESFVLLKQLLS